MRDLTITTTAKLYRNDELPAEYVSLVEEAKRQTSHSYSPYSHFAVGAAALLVDGTVIGGSNQENAAYPSGLCAERTTLFYANSMYPDKPVKALAIACFTGGHFTSQPGTPCGSCRQVMIESEHRAGQPMVIILYGTEQTCVFSSAQDLLPLSFFAEAMSGEGVPMK
ncbi:MAG: cytidine deaminase [Paludibacteraceae bacterium]|nr:cytidine deaminase [Paludibacteraceae bacterium]